MTVCIAAIVESDDRIISVADSKVAFGDFSSDQGAVKHFYLNNGYTVMLAGNDVAYAVPTIARAKEKIKRGKVFDPDEVADILHSELCETRNRIIEAKILRKYGLTTKTFLAKGKQSFTESVFYDICSKIDHQELSIQFLLAGFDENGNGNPHLRVIHPNDVPHDYDALGFASIGSGASSAMASLSFAKDHCSFGRHSDLRRGSYNLLAAKFMSESATDVGKDTFYVSIHRTKGGSFISPFHGIDAIRKAWERQGAPRDSPTALRVLDDVIYGPNEKFLVLRSYRELENTH